MRCTSKTKALIDEMNREIEIANSILDNNEEKLAFLPSDYWETKAIDYIIKVLNTGRAADLNQAMTMCDEQLHRWKLEEATEMMSEEMMRQTKIQKNIDRATTVDAVTNLMRTIGR